MADTICDRVASYLTTLDIGNEICTAVGTTLTFNTNLFIGIEPADPKVSVITIIPYGGSGPVKDRQNPAIQIRTKTYLQNPLSIPQALINDLHDNELSGSGKVISLNSAPILIGSFQGGQYTISTTNFEVKHVNLT